MKTRRGSPSPPASGPLQAERHRPMRDAGFHEYCAMHDEPCTRIESECMRLGMQMHGRVAPRAGAIDQPVQNGLPHALPAPCRADGHAADMTVGQQPPGADRLSGGIQCQGVNRHCIVSIPFEFFRDLLLDNEHLAAQVLQGGEIVAP